MKIVVLNGSPKGDVSVTMQYVNYLIKKYPQHEFKTVNISQRIKAIEKNQNEFAQVIAEVQSADGVLWAFPLYFMIVHAHYKRFIELVFERGRRPLLPASTLPPCRPRSISSITPPTITFTPFAMTWACVSSNPSRPK